MPFGVRGLVLRRFATSRVIARVSAPRIARCPVVSCAALRVEGTTYDAWVCDFVVVHAQDRIDHRFSLLNVVLVPGHADLPQPLGAPSGTVGYVMYLLAY